MSNLAVKIALIESESGWGQRVDDWMVCLSVEDALEYKQTFNSEHKSSFVPQWYMFVEGEVLPIDLTDNQMKHLKENKRVYWSTLKRVE